MKVNPKCCYLLQVTLRPRETESLSDFLLISVGLDMGSQTVLQDENAAVGFIWVTWGIWGFFGTVLLFTGYSEQTQEFGTGSSMIKK